MRKARVKLRDGNEDDVHITFFDNACLYFVDNGLNYEYPWVSVESITFYEAEKS